MHLSSPISKLPLVGNSYAEKLSKLNIFTIHDLLLHAPTRYKDLRIISDIANVQVGETITVQGVIKSIKNVFTRNRKNFQIAEITDSTGTIQAIWFNQVYLAKGIKEGERYSLSGKVQEFNRKKTLTSPDHENIERGNNTIHTGKLVPIYPETAGVSSKWLRSRVDFAAKTLESELEEYLPREILVKYDYPNFKDALTKIHSPNELADSEKARERLSFDEFLFNHLKSLLRKKEWSKHKVSRRLNIEEKTMQEFLDSLPFTLTNSQTKALKEIKEDLGKEIPMNRLLEGDVGSGKTAVAGGAAFMAFANGYQTVFMAPTQILSDQHYNTLSDIFKNFKIRVSLVTSSSIKTDVGRTDIYVGTHALIHKKVKFDNVGLVVIDEQHRFGVEQREHLIKKSKRGRYLPNVLTMTATPIPRTIALTVYGDMDLSVLDELPKGRQPITTWIVQPQKRVGAYNWIRKQVKKEKIQVFFICPLIEESEAETMKSVKAAKKVYEELGTDFKGLKLGLLHGKQKVTEKNETLKAFRNGKIDILVSTPVVEVGIDVPNATIMVIEAGERYGLSQLHQLRGRIGRGEKKSYCLVFTENRSPKVTTRLQALTKKMSGFELAELDLKMRGPGDVYGTRQHGFPDLKIASWGDTELIKKSREFAEEVINNPNQYSRLIEKTVPRPDLRT